MEIYYWESDFRYGEFRAGSDQEAIEKAFKKMYGGDQLLVVYKESETDDGTPFIIVWEK